MLIHFMTSFLLRARLIIRHYRAYHLISICRTNPPPPLPLDSNKKRMMNIGINVVVFFTSCCFFGKRKLTGQNAFKACIADVFISRAKAF